MSLRNQSFRDSIEWKFTEIYKEHQSSDKYTREMAALEVMYPAILTPIQDGDLLAGRIRYPLVGFDAESGHYMCYTYYCERGHLSAMLGSPDLTEQDREDIQAVLDFWEGETTRERLRASYPEWLQELIPDDDYFKFSNVAHGIYRLTGAYLDYAKLLDLGIDGFHKHLDKRQARADTKGEAYDPKFFESLHFALDILSKSLLHYSKQAELLYAATGDKAMQKIADACAHVSRDKPRTLLEAIELSWLVSILSGTMNYGRMDDYLGPYLIADIEAGRETPESVQALLNSFWQIIADRKTRVHSRVIVGGRGRKHPEAGDEFARYAIQASRTIHEIEPQLTLRLDDDTPEDIRRLSLQCLAEGRTYPLVYNEQVNIDSVMKAFKVDEETAEQYMPFGCGEYVINHQSFGTPSGIINLLKALEITLYGGVDQMTGRDTGLNAGTLHDYETFEDLWDAYTKQVERYVDGLALIEKMEYDQAGEDAPYTFFTLLFDDCIERMKPIFSGGIRYLGGTIEAYGNTNTADSLMAIKQLVYDEGSVTKDELLTAMKANFEGYEDLRQRLLDAPKFGNDETAPDEMMQRVHNHICDYSASRAEVVGLHSYLVVIINNETNTILGRQTAASADGRLSGSFMANAINPQGGADKEGLSAMLNSLAKLDTTIHAGGVQNIKLSRDLFEQHLPELRALLRTFFEQGGQQYMLTVLNRDDLEQAMIEPEKYKNLFVRVGGFSARFINLDRDVQEEILSRTLY